uniref:Uncharacterized protein n=1 Tax=Zea mays TaxID=4577 RepID=A0A804NTJ6_MAIZE
MDFQKESTFDMWSTVGPCFNSSKCHSFNVKPFHLMDKQLKSHPPKNVESEILSEHIKKEKGGSKGWKMTILSEERNMGWNGGR